MAFSIFYNSHSLRRRYSVLVAAAFLLLIGWSIKSSEPQFARSATPIQQPSIFRIGEKLSYSVSFGKFANAAFAETFVASRGTLSGRDAVEIRSRVKTLEMVSAAFFLVDESRTVYASPDTGLPLYIASNSNDSIVPQEKISNYLTQPASGFDILTAVYKARESGGSGTFPIYENEQLSTVTFLPTTSEKVKTDAGDFDTVISVVQAPMLTSLGIKELSVNFTTDEARIPVQVRFKTDRGPFRAVIRSIAFPEPATQAPTPTLTPLATETPAATPRPTPSPEQYIENRPLLPELGFQLGEVLEYAITAEGKPLARITFNVRERKLFETTDSLLLTATVTSVEPGNGIYFLGDNAQTQVDPETLAPIWAMMKFNSSMAGLKQTVTFDKKTGMVKFGDQQLDSPIGTHNLLSLLYAMRSFNLRPSRDRSNPVNDTRVAVFWEDKTHIFTLRPSVPEEITLNGEKVSAQLISINTQNAQLDTFAIKVWLGAEDRVPLRLTAGLYQADLISRGLKTPR
jgi:hypothetical protein